nr:uncharacterized serine-rich protein C215.13-like [Ipomoea batatas]
MCSPTIHPGSFRCSLHKHRGHGQATPYLSKRRSFNKSSLVVRLGTVESDLLAKRALAIHIRPSSHSLRRRFDFQLRSSRLSQMSKAEDANQKENEDVASIEGEKKDESSSKERDGISIERNKDCCDDKPSLEAEQHGHLYFQFCDTLSPYWRIPFIEKIRAMSVANIVGKSKKELYDIMCEMKKLMEQNEEQARQILIENPTLARDLFHAQIMLGMVQPTQPSPSHVNQSAPAGPNEKAAP